MIDAGSIMAAIPDDDLATMAIDLNVLESLGDVRIFSQDQVRFYSTCTRYRCVHCLCVRGAGASAFDTYKLQVYLYNT